VGGVQVSFDKLKMWAVPKSEMTAANDLNNTSSTQATIPPLAQAQAATNDNPKVTRGSTLTVCPGGCEYSSIQAAVDAASPGDIVKVQSGTYEGDVNIVEDNITLRGVDTGGGCPNLDGGVTSNSAPTGCWGTLNGPWNIQSAVGPNTTVSGKKMGDVNIGTLNGPWNIQSAV
jgi:pectin methylesterase-like acyl-CoA thioesterase